MAPSRQAYPMLSLLCGCCDNMPHRCQGLDTVSTCSADLDYLMVCSNLTALETDVLKVRHAPATATLELCNSLPQDVLD